MTKTYFVPQTPITAQYLNAVNNPRFVLDPQNDGEIGLIQDDWLDQADSSLLARSNRFLNAFNTTADEGLLVLISAGTVLLADSTPVTKQATQVGPLAAGATNFIWLDPAGEFKHATSAPNDGSVMVAKATTDASSVTLVEDLRPRFKVGAEDYDAPAVIGAMQGFAFEVPGLEFTDEFGWVWLNPTDGLTISSASGVGSANDDGYERLFKRLWTNPRYDVVDGTGTVVQKSTDQGDWDAGRGLRLPAIGGFMPMAAGSADGENYFTGERDGERTHTMSEGEMFRHSHPGSNSPPHTHEYSRTDEGDVGDPGGNRFFPSGDDEGGHVTAGTGPTAATINVEAQGNNQPWSQLPPYFVETRLIFSGRKVV